MQALREQGLTTQAQHAQRLELINQRYTKTARAQTEGRCPANRDLARHEMVNLGRQAQDVGVSLVSGQSPFTVLVQQGTQIADVFATSGGTMRGFFSQAIGWAKTFLTSYGGIVTVVAAVGAAAVYAASQFLGCVHHDRGGAGGAKPFAQGRQDADRCTGIRRGQGESAVEGH